MSPRMTLLQVRAIAAIHSGRVAVEAEGTVYAMVGYGARVRLAVDPGGTVGASLVLDWVARTVSASTGRPLVQKNDRSP